MTRTPLAALLAAAALLALTSGCSRKTPCARLAAEICESGDDDDCAAFVDREMVNRGAQISTEHKQIACRIVLDDEATVRVMQRAFEGRQAGSGGSAKNGSASK